MNRLGDLVGGVIVQGITGQAARRHARRMLEYGTPLVAGVRPGVAGETVEGVPVFDTVDEAVDATGATATVAFLPPEAVVDGLVEAAAAGLALAVSVTEGVPLHGALRAVEAADRAGMRLIGPNSPGLALPHARLLLGFLPVELTFAGSVALVTRSGTLSYEVALALARADIGLAVWVGIGGDRVKGSRFVDVFPLLLSDPAVEALVLIGEIGGNDEQEVAPLLADTGLPVVALIAGRSAPSGVVMGHAGAIVDGESGSYSAKVAALEAAGVTVVERPTDLVPALAQSLAEVGS